MRFSSISVLAVLSNLASATILRPREYDTYDYYAVHLDPSQTPSAVASYFGLDLEGPLGALQDHYLFRKPRHDGNVIGDALVEHRRKLKKRDLSYRNDLLDAVLLQQKQKLRAPHEKRGPLYPHLNIRQSDEELEEELEEEILEEEIIEEILEEIAEYEKLEAAMAPAQGESLEAYGARVATALGIADPIYKDQWHLYNPVERGHDLNVTGVWLQGITGMNTTVVIVDDGLDMDSEDLRENFYAEGSYDFNDRGPEPRPRLSDDRHGTRCAGEVSAVKNNVCGVGVAFNSKIAGIRILSKPITDADEAIAMNYGYDKTQIYSCSWGPPDDGQQMGEPGILIKRAMVNAVQKGRGGLGTIYVFAAGNGAAADDNCNFDGYTNSIYSITVGAIDRRGQHPYYSEKCSAQLIVTYSSGSGDAIHTTDVGTRNCYSGHGGTSAAGPLAVGVFALVLEIRPDLTWRDMQWLTVLTAVKLDQESDWQETALGKQFSHQFGYGKLDAWAIVEAAKTFKAVKPQAWFFSPWQHVRREIPQGDRGLASTFTVTEEVLQQANIERLEHVTVTTNVDHTRRGDLSIELRSPSGVVSHLSTARMKDSAPEGYIDWTFMSVAHWGESGVGDWTIIVKDTIENDHNGTFVDWKLNLFGESRDPEIQGLLPLPDEHDDDDHDREDANASITSIVVPTPTDLPGNPDDHIDRPVNDKPTITEQLPPPTNIPEVTDPVDTSPAFDDDNDYFADEKPGDFSDDADDDSSYDSNPDLADWPADGSTPPAPSATDLPASGSYLGDWLLPSFLPTFGVSKATQVWIYGSAALIVVFCTGIAIYLIAARRRRQRALQRENYEFEMLAHDEDGDGKDGIGGGRNGKKNRRRAGELYDAFAGESDEEMFSEDEEEEDHRYRDNEGTGFGEKVKSEKRGD